MSFKRTQLLQSGLLLGLILLPLHNAHAYDNTQVWRSSNGEIVYNSWDQCVRSDDVIDHDPCAPAAAPAVAQIAPATVVTTVIGEADRTVYFVFDKSYLTQESMQHLNSLANRLSAADDIVGARIVGYADRIGSIQYNERLSQRRAETVRTYLMDQGFLKPSKTETRWVGKSQPTAACPGGLKRSSLIECLQPDRKVVVEVVYRTETRSQEPQRQSMQQVPEMAVPPQDQTPADND